MEYLLCGTDIAVCIFHISFAVAIQPGPNLIKSYGVLWSNLASGCSNIFNHSVFMSAKKYIARTIVADPHNVGFRG